MTDQLLALIIEDDIDQATIFAGALQAAGFDVEVIRDGGEGLRRLTAIVPDVVVLDLHLPRTSGADILDAIREDARLDKSRVIVATADPRMAEILDEKADLVLIKPISFVQLRDLAGRLKPVS
jgi:DNA-binding response OmpR family regulator